MKSKKILSLLMSFSILGTSFLSVAPNVQAANIKNVQVSKNVTVQATKASAMWGTVNADVLNVRQGPGTDYSKIGQLTHGTKVLIVDSVPGWSEIAFGSGYGWVASEYISVYE